MTTFRSKVRHLIRKLIDTDHDRAPSSQSPMTYDPNMDAIQARRQSSCGMCGQRIDPGDTVIIVDDEPCHLECVENHVL